MARTNDELRIFAVEFVENHVQWDNFDELLRLARRLERYLMYGDIDEEEVKDGPVQGQEGEDQGAPLTQGDAEVS